MHIYRWDLDRTYLDTNIGSVRALLKHAFETAAQKRNIPGSATLLRQLTDWDPEARVSIVSGSPTQLRRVLEEKLALDGIRFESLTLKDSLANLKRGRLREVRGQLGYKLSNLLRQRIGLGRFVHETLFGDDWEIDALVYAVYAEAIAGTLSESELARIMETGGAYPDAIQETLGLLGQIGRANAIEDIFIHCDRGTPTQMFELLGNRVSAVFSWLQAALVLWQRGRLSAPGTLAVVRACTTEAEFGHQRLCALFQDAVRRGLVRSTAIVQLFEETDFYEHSDRILSTLSQLGPFVPQRSSHPPDPIAYLRTLKTLHG